MDKKIYLNLLYDYYKDLLTEKQQNYFEEYYCYDYSLSEIASNENVSRNAVHGQLKLVEDKLIEFEKCLQLVEKKNKVLKLLNHKVDEKTLQKIEDIL